MADVQGVPDFDPSEMAYVYTQVADHISLRITAGDLRPGSRLPGERALAEEYGVALGTVRRAIEELRDRGLVVTLPAKGTFVAVEAENDADPAGSV
ncbi:winged helix-turn-helix domain-containing protein [Streptosporangium sp. G11]|uniref:winged helix-turn-helix domain-containing protein n=1 Tax=Streptosporangium sp. G11 TaxID=3436926 RepID=UPI003EB78E85